jgi:hypothetical protein
MSFSVYPAPAAGGQTYGAVVPSQLTTAGTSFSTSVNLNLPQGTYAVGSTADAGVTFIENTTLKQLVTPIPFSNYQNSATNVVTVGADSAFTVYFSVTLVLPFQDIELANANQIGWNFRRLNTTQTAYVTQNALCLTTNGTNYTVATTASIFSTSRNIYDIASNGADTWVVVSTTTGIAITTNAGSTWSEVTGSTSHTKYGIVYSADTTQKWVTVGTSGRLETSTNGTTWATQTSTTSATLWGIAFGAGVFVAVGDNGWIAHSSNATSWTGSQVGSVRYRRVAYNASADANLWLAVGDGNYATSTNGTTWSSVSAPWGNVEVFSITVLGDSFYVSPSQADYSARGAIIWRWNGSSWAQQAIQAGPAYGGNAGLILSPSIESTVYGIVRTPNNAGGKLYRRVHILTGPSAYSTGSDIGVAFQKIA